jgi:hypothetical protein
MVRGISSGREAHPMEKVVVDLSLVSVLDRCGSQVELCDPTGRALGIFIPMAERLSLAYAWAQRQFTDEEIDLARQEAGGLTIHEVLKETSGE